MSKYMITYKVVKVKGVEGTYENLPRAQKRLKDLQEVYVGTRFEIRKMTNNNLYKYANMEKEEIFRVPKEGG